jgi:hypothetical protein
MLAQLVRLRLDVLGLFVFDEYDAAGTMESSGVRRYVVPFWHQHQLVRAAAPPFVIYLPHKTAVFLELGSAGRKAAVSYFVASSAMSCLVFCSIYIVVNTISVLALLCEYNK